MHQLAHAREIAVFKTNQAFSSYSVNDLDAALDFYSDKLGLEAEKTKMDTVNLKLSGGQTVMLYPKPNHEPATFTVLNLIVSDVDKAVDDLTSAGIEMEHYDIPEINQDGRGIARDEDGQAMAWFKDPAGNIIAVLQIP